MAQKHGLGSLDGHGLRDRIDAAKHTDEKILSEQGIKRRNLTGGSFLRLGFRLLLVPALPLQLEMPRFVDFAPQPGQFPEHLLQSFPAFFAIRGIPTEAVLQQCARATQKFSIWWARPRAA